MSIIPETDLVFLQSERLDDTPQGGGRMTGVVIPDGQENNLFPDIAPTDWVFGRVRLRKFFAANRSDTADLYLGAHVLISQQPTNPALSITLFSTGNWTDTRADARDYIERYLTRGGYWPAQLYGNHLAGQRALQFVQMPHTETPAAGQTLVLIQDEGKGGEQEQYVRVTRAESTERVFVDGQGEFTRQVITAEISDPLRADFLGDDPARYSATQSRTRVRATVAAAAAHYYGARPLAAPAQADDRVIQVDSLYTQLVPSAQTETPLTDLSAASLAEPLTPCGAGVSLTTSAPLSPSARLYLGVGITPGSLTLTTAGATLTDNGRGQVLSGSTVVATVDYTEGSMVGVTGGPSYSGSKTCAWTPAAAPASVSHTAGIDVTAETRGLNFVLTLEPIPRPGTLRVDYRSGGKWYRLSDRGDGGLVGISSAHGAGSLNFTSGTVTVTCGALPDVNSSLLFFWAVAADTSNRGNAALDPPAAKFTLAHPPLIPGTLTLDWLLNGVAKTAHDSAGTIVGDASGTVNYATGELALMFPTLPPPGKEIAASYQHGPPREVTFSHPLRDGNGDLALTLPDPNLIAGSVEIEWNLIVLDYDAAIASIEELRIPAQRPFDPIQIVRDNGTGGWSGGLPGSVNYSAGTLLFTPDVTVELPKPRYGVRSLGTRREALAGGGFLLTTVARTVFTGWDYVPAGAQYPNDDSGWVKVRYRVAGTDTAAETLVVASLTLDVTKRFTEDLVPNALSFALGGSTYVERAGSLYRDIDPATNAGTPAGTVEYSSGRATLSAWPALVAPAQALKALLVRVNAPVTDETCFRVALAPVRPGSLSIRATPVKSSGAAINVTADTVGRVYQAGVVDGHIDYQTGVVRLRWGGWVLDSSLTNEQKQEVWYSEEARQMLDGVLKIFKPRPVYADTVRYNAVGYSYLPLSADIIGLDPVRLPSDGRVPCLSVGDLALISHSTTHAVANPSAGGTVDTGLTGVARARVYDATGAALPPNRFTLEPITGVVTWANPLDLTGTTGPYTVEAMIEDAALITDADINGQITLNLPLTHDYPEGALVSSAFVFGDLFAQTGVLFAQQAWTGVWSDERIGNPILAQYNVLQHPVEQTNAASWRERWMLLFTSTTAFRVIGETLGDITDALGGAGFHDTSHDLAPINPLTGTPYFILRWPGWGSGWVAGNLLRLNLLPPAHFPVWVAQTVQPSPPTEGLDRFRLLLRGGVDA